MIQIFDDFLKSYNWFFTIVFIFWFFRKQIRSLIEKVIENFARISELQAGKTGLNVKLLVDEQRKAMENPSSTQPPALVQLIGLDKKVVGKHFSSELWKNGIIIHRIKLNLDNINLLEEIHISLPFSISTIMSANIIGNISYRLLTLTPFGLSFIIETIHDNTKEIEIVATGI